MNPQNNQKNRLSKDTNRPSKIKKKNYNSGSKVYNTPTAINKKIPPAISAKNIGRNAPPHRQSQHSDLKNNLKSQTPLNRKLNKQTLPAEPGTRRRTSAPQYYKLKNNKATRRKTGVFRRTALLVFIFYSVMMISTVIFFSLKIPKSSLNSNNYLYQTATEKNILSKEWVSQDTVKSGDTFYLNMTKIAKLYEMVTTGDSVSMKYTVRESDESLELILGQSLAYINGIPQRMEAPCKLKNGEVFVSADFINRCFNCITVNIDRELNKITLIRETDSNGDFVKISFPYKNNQLNTAIDFFSLSDQLKTVILSSNNIESTSNLSKLDS